MSTAPRATDRRLLRVTEVAERLGISKATVNRKLNAGDIRYVLMDGRRRVDTRDLEAYMDSLQPTMPRLTARAERG